jgi:holin-like protein
MIPGLAILFCFLAAGEAASAWSGLPVPGSVLGMLLLAGALELGLLPGGSVQAAADLLLENLSLLFVPAGVGLLVYLGLPARDWWSLLAGLVPGTFLVMAAVGWLQQLLERPAGPAGISPAAAAREG